METCGSTNEQSSATRGHDEVWQRAGGGNERRNWEMLDFEVLTLIFKRISADELSRVVPFVCREWREMIAGPHCWADIDIAEWCQWVINIDIIDNALRKLVCRSRYTLQRLSAYGIGNLGFSVTASYGIHLKVLQIPASDVTDKSIEEFSGTLKALQELDISYCYNITSKGIKILGKNCTSLIHLKRNDTFYNFLINRETKFNENEALAVASTMPGLQKLELYNGLFSDYGLNSILRSCKALSSLDIRGCIKVKLVGDVGRTFYALKYSVNPSYNNFDYLDPYEY